MENTQCTVVIDQSVPEGEVVVPNNLENVIKQNQAEVVTLVRYPNPKPITLKIKGISPDKYCYISEKDASRLGTEYNFDVLNIVIY